MALKTRFVWRVLDGDRLAMPAENGPHYDRVALNEAEYSDSFETRDAAIARLEYWAKKHPSNEDFVLIEIYSTR